MLLVRICNLAAKIRINSDNIISFAVFLFKFNKIRLFVSESALCADGLCMAFRGRLREGWIVPGKRAHFTPFANKASLRRKEALFEV